MQQYESSYRERGLYGVLNHSSDLQASSGSAARNRGSEARKVSGQETS